MPTLTINIAGRGTPLAGGGTSSVGHMWFELNNGASGISQSYGFAPDGNHHGQPFAPGDIYRDDNSNYLDRNYSRTIEISQDQYDAMTRFGQDPTSYGFSMRYNGLNNSCIDFTWKALETGGLNPTGFEGAVWPTWNDVDDFVDAVNGVFDDLFNNFARALSFNYINDAWARRINDPWGSARAWQPRIDPLALDLDGDGIETRGVDGTVVFDHDGDGIRTGTGWIKADDALLVLDRNGNGTIDSGAELFGVDTVLADGTKATDGFAALRDLDSNGDGVFDAADAKFANVRLWRDLDQDGVSDNGELISLSQAGIVSISLSASAARKTLAGGNVQTATASFTRADGSTGEAGDVDLSGTAANLDFASNPFYREFTDSIPITAQAAALPDMSGSAGVRHFPPILTPFRKVPPAPARVSKP